ncbi:hypothetical protein LB557_29440 [Mesorhizobium sp. BR115XR7A]|uniref:hypothetical protein n=1 Tax=Mesorhizobium sp. BR115XR7A TaxID=2876645 RepID=UPI001CCC4DB0|nr:hypothetical protein [Mesorhizobium sp. BR115XR7A]MBZ9910131.1 hypothetical protein [Mesorhizobium sp. BR115XR7A]MBZ9933888.1 hypothetical protein [Mesorhizobium sp. BR1-1-5]
MLRIPEKETAALDASRGGGIGDTSRSKSRRKQGESQAAWREANRAALKAHNKVGWAIRSGKLKRGVCSVCGSDRHVDAHHPTETDELAYQKPLEAIVWLCRSHHRQLHARLPKRGRK